MRISNIGHQAYLNKTLIFLLISKWIISLWLYEIWLNLEIIFIYSNKLCYFIKFYIHVYVKNLYLSLNMLNMLFSMQFYLFFSKDFVRIILAILLHYQNHMYWHFKDIVVFYVVILFCAKTKFIQMQIVHLWHNLIGNTCMSKELRFPPQIRQYCKKGGFR